jgi:hypothetical protein
MKNLYILLSILAIFFASCAGPKIALEENALNTIKTDVEYLASDELEGRETGTVGEAKAAAFIVKRFQSADVMPKGEDGYFQRFTKKVPANPHADAKASDPEINVKNVIGYLDKGAPYTVIIGGHYDHLGYGAEGSLYTGDKEIHNGADDNASGIAAMLAIAEYYSERKCDYNLLFIGFSGEEKGLWGSNYYSKNPTVDLDKVSFMLNMDMVGRLNDERKLAINGVGTSPSWDELLESLKKPKFNTVTTESGVGPSDHTSFYLQDLPVLHFFTGQHEDYHRPTDDSHLVNFKGISDIATYLIALIEEADGEKLAFTKTKDETTRNPEFKVTLGVIPDYLFDGKGMRIDGVKEGRPASNAGMIKGDVVTKIGEFPVDDMMGYMKCLAKFEKGETTKVQILRDGKSMTLSVTF